MFVSIRMKLRHTFEQQTILKFHLHLPYLNISIQSFPVISLTPAPFASFHPYPDPLYQLDNPQYRPSVYLNVQL